MRRALAARRRQQNPRLSQEWLRYFAARGAREVEGGFVWKVDPYAARGFGPWRPEWIAPAWRGLAMPMLPDGWHQVEGWDIALSSGRRYDAWRAGYDVLQVAEAWRALIRSNRAEPAQRRFRSGRRTKA